MCVWCVCVCVCKVMHLNFISEAFLCFVEGFLPAQQHKKWG